MFVKTDIPPSLYTGCVRAPRCRSSLVSTPIAAGNDVSHPKTAIFSIGRDVSGRSRPCAATASWWPHAKTTSKWIRSSNTMAG